MGEITIYLNPELEAALAEQARDAELRLDEYAAMLLEEGETTQTDAFRGDETEVLPTSGAWTGAGASPDDAVLPQEVERPELGTL